MIPAALTMTFSPDTARAWVDVDLAALVANARTVAAVCGSRLLPMVKANGYGLGAVAVARALEPVDPWGFGVAIVEEGARAPRRRDHRPILRDQPARSRVRSTRYLEHDLRPAIGDPAALEAWIARGERPFHLEIDTGMSRAGVRWDDEPALAARRGTLRAAPGLGRGLHPLSHSRTPIRRPPHEQWRPVSGRRWHRCLGARRWSMPPTAPPRFGAALRRRPGPAGHFPVRRRRRWRRRPRPVAALRARVVARSHARGRGHA